MGFRLETPYVKPPEPHICDVPALYTSKRKWYQDGGEQLYKPETIWRCDECGENYRVVKSRGFVENVEYGPVSWLWVSERKARRILRKNGVSA